MRHDGNKRRPDLDDEHETQFAQQDEEQPQGDPHTQDFDIDFKSTKPGVTVNGVSSVIKLIRSRTGGSGVTPLD